MERHQNRRGAFELNRVGLLFRVVEKPLRFRDFPGSAWRGVFGSSLRRLTCLAKKDDCDAGCSRPGLCLYGRVFAPPRGEGGGLGFNDPPRPFALRCPAAARFEYPPGIEYSLEIVLFGEAVNWAPAVVAAINQAASRGVGPDRTVLELVSAEEDAVFPFATLRSSDRVALNFTAPTRIVQKGNFVKAPEFPVLLRAILRRVMAIEALCGARSERDVSQLLSLAEGVRLADAQVYWWDWHRKSGRTQQIMPFGGFAGQLVYEGDLSPFEELLALGSLLNVGKHATFGMGRYEVLE